METNRVHSSLMCLFLVASGASAKLGGKFLPVPVGFSSPETGIGGGAKLRWQDPYDKPGFADITAYTTQKVQSHLDMEVMRDSLDGIWRLNGYGEFGKFPGKWFGLGNPPDDSLASIYTPVYLAGWFSASRWLTGGWLVGAKLTLENWDIHNDHQGIYRTQRFTGDKGGFEADIGIEITREGRDLATNPKSGSYLKLSIQTSVPGTDFDWQNLIADASQTVTFSDITAVVRGHHEEVWGSVPFWKTPFLGNRKFLRGIPDKRLRGEVAQCLGTEVRWNTAIKWLQPALFGEIGKAGGHAEVWTADVNWAAGLGLRAPLADGKAVLRADYGWSEVGSGLYVDFGHAF
jgi:hypothetical protein